MKAFFALFFIFCVIPMILVLIYFKLHQLCDEQTYKQIIKDDISGQFISVCMIFLVIICSCWCQFDISNIILWKYFS